MRLRFLPKRMSRMLALLFFVTGGAVMSFSQAGDFDQAMALFRLKQWKEAAAAFAATDKMQPGKTEALLFQAKCLVNLGQFAAADMTLKEYIAGHPRSEDAGYLLAYAYFREDKPRESLQQFTAAAQLKTPTADDLKIVALDYVLLNDYRDAGHYLEEALKMDPENVEVRYHLGRVRYQQNQFDEAIAAFQDVLKRDPGNVKAQDNLGLSLEAENQLDRAIAEYRKAIALDEASTVHSKQPYLNLGALLSKANKSEEASVLLLKAAEIDPKSSKIRYELGKAYFDLNRFDDSRKEEEEAVRLDAKNAAAHYLLGRVYQRTGKSDLAAQQFKLTDEMMRSPGENSGSSPMPPPENHK
jgi:tetratricopeptide (TPR) repeat protein